MSNSSTPSAGLRQRQRQSRRQAMLEAALALFGDRGYEATTIEQVAVVANVSPATVYNYFSTKDELLIEAFEFEWVRGEAALGRLPRRATDDPVRAITRLVEAYNRFDESIGPPALWRQLMAASLTAGPDARRSYQRINDRFRAVVRGELERLAAAGRIDADADLGAMASIIAAIADAAFTRSARTAEVWPRRSTTLRREIAIAVDGAVVRS